MTVSMITRTDGFAPGSAFLPPQERAMQGFDGTRQCPIALDQGTCNASINSLNQLLADTITLRDMYKKHYWQVSGPTFFQLHRLFDRHFEGQLELVDQIAERVEMRGGVTVAMAHDVAERTLIPRAPESREDSSTQISRLLHAHEIILEESRTMARETSKHGDGETSDLIIDDVIRINEMQVRLLFVYVTQQHM